MLLTECLPSVSIVMACLNSRSTVEATICSLQSQSMKNWELILIDDGSTDGTEKILQHIAGSDSRISYISQQNNGLTQALIRGCNLAKAPLIARQDADDISLPNRLAQQHQLLSKRPEVGFVSCFADYIGPRDEYLSTVIRPADSIEATEKLLNERLGPPAHGTVMFRKSIYDQVGGYRPQFYYAQDSDLWMRMAEVSQIAYVQESCYRFRWHENSITGSGRSLQSEFGRLGQLCRKARREGQSEQPWLEQAEQLRAAIVERRQQPTQTFDSAAKKSSQLSMTYLIACQLVANKDPRARSYLRQVLRHQPWHWRAWVRLAQSLVSGEKRDARNEV
ncbi:MAG: glycosyltransferase [Planctomycetaceae bacterium]|nr:glycosyltransferase [Planctomycetaceae bacterium]MCA9084334.1 glycosyltransferase [Planctomycetaceae bacterium]